jgi:RNA polymerase sigma-54 factor
MSMAPRLDLRQSQSLVMTPQLQQAIRLLALSNLEVEAFLAEEIEKNPLLEGGAADAADDGPDDRSDDRSDDRNDASALEEGDGAPPDAATADQILNGNTVGDDTPLDADYAEETYHHDAMSDRASASDDSVDFDSFTSAADSLIDHLTHQAGECLSGADLAIAIQIIDQIDEAGYLTGSLLELAHRLGVLLVDVERVLLIVQTFDPTGVGARSLAECLALQAREADRYDPCMALLIDHLDLLATGKIAQLQRMCMVDDDDMADMIRELRRYDPKPGLRFGFSPVEAVTPDVFVTETSKGWRVEINSASLPRVLVDRRYHAELAADANDKASKAWLNDCLASANWLVKALDQRQRTIVIVASEIVKQQHGFFRHGVSALKPLTLKTVADAVGLHESTVSRVTSNKYMGCARGVFELKFFFSSGIATMGLDGAADGEAASALAVKAAIRSLIADEAQNAILSDDTLVDLLGEKGFDLARRTVAKYREAMGIGSSVQRRRARAIDMKAA